MLLWKEIRMSTQQNYREAITKVYSSLKGKKRLIADQLLSDPIHSIELSIADFATLCRCDQTTVVRFAQRLGYSGYAELKLAVARQSEALWQEFKSEQPGRASENKITDALIRLHCESISATLRNIDQTAVQNLVNKISKAQHVMICGAGSSALQAEDLSVRLSRLGVFTYFYRDFELWKTFLGYLGKDDLLLLFSNSGETPSIIELARSAKQKDIFIAAVVSFPTSTLAKCSDIAIITENRGELPIRLGAMTSRTAQFLVVDMLTVFYSMIDKEKSWDFLEKSYV